MCLCSVGIWSVENLHFVAFALRWGVVRRSNSGYVRNAMTSFLNNNNSHLIITSEGVGAIETIEIA